MNHCGIDKRFARFRQGFVVLAQTSVFAEPGEGAFHDPTGRQDHEPRGRSRVRALDNQHFDADAEPLPTVGGQGLTRTRIAAIENQFGPACIQRHPPQQVAQPFTVLPVGRMDFGPYQQTQRIDDDDDMPFAPFDFLATVEAAWSPFSAVLTDWLSATRTLGSLSRPALCRTCSRSASLRCSHTPRRFSIRKYEYTVCHAGKSCGNARHATPPRSTYQIASNNSRGRCSRGRPVRCLGSSGSILAHAPSLKSVGYAFRFPIPPVYPHTLSFKTLSKCVSI